MFKRTEVSTALAVAFGGALAVLAMPGLAQEQKLERVEITGSAIKRVDAEGPAPVEVYTRKEISKTGATTVNELLRSIPSIEMFDQGELASNSPSGSGTASIGMRGLDSSNVLVLLNGRRLPVNALYDSSGAGAAFDINTIPLSAVERVEILKDGGSAIYGADAVAGVFNIITKKDYQGIEVRAGYGSSSRNDGTEKQAGLVAGFGSLKDDRVNVLVGIDLFKRDPIFRKDRDISSTVNFSRFGGRDGRSSFAPGGNIVNPVSGDFAGVSYAGCAPQDLSSGICRYDFNSSILTAYNGADRVSGMALATVQLNPDTRAFLELTAAESKDHFEAHPVPDYFNVPITNPGTQGAFEDPEHPGTVIIAGRFMQGGPRITDRKASLINFVAGAEGVFNNLDWKANIGRGTSKVTNSDRNYYNADLWSSATTGGDINPTRNDNDATIVNGLKVSPVRKGESTITTANFLVSGDASELPAGTLRYALGASAWREELSDTPDELTQAGKVVGSIQQAAVSAARTAKAIFGELAIPLHKTLEAQAALRYDNYPEASQTSPKAAIKYTPSPELAFRASYTASFRVAALKQLFGAEEQGAITITDEDSCKLLGLPSCGVAGVNAFQVNGPNAELKPEKGETWNFGVLMDLGSYVNLGIDYWRIEKTDEINSPTTATAIKKGLFDRDGARFRVYTNLLNLAERTTSGVDIDWRLRIPGTAVGSISIRNMLTYNIHSLRRDDPADEVQEFVGSYANPRFRNTFSVSSEMGAWNWQASIRTVGGFRDDDDPASIDASTRRVGAHEELDIQSQFLGFKNLTLTAGIKNLLDRQPPLSILNGTDNNYTQMGFAELYSSRGRFLYGSLNYKF